MVFHPINFHQQSSTARVSPKPANPLAGIRIIKPTSQKANTQKVNTQKVNTQSKYNNK